MSSQTRFLLRTTLDHQVLSMVYWARGYLKSLMQPTMGARLTVQPLEKLQRVKLAGRRSRKRGLGRRHSRLRRSTPISRVILTTCQNHIRCSISNPTSWISMKKFALRVWSAQGSMLTVIRGWPSTVSLMTRLSRGHTTSSDAKTVRPLLATYFPCHHRQICFSSFFLFFHFFFERLTWLSKPQLTLSRAASSASEDISHLYGAAMSRLQRKSHFMDKYVSRSLSLAPLNQPKSYYINQSQIWPTAV